MSINRYAVYVADLNPTRGAEMNKIRPVVVVSGDEMNDALLTIVICPLTTHLHPRWRGRIQIKSEGKSAEIAVDQIRTISKIRLKKKIGSLSSSDANELRRLISEMYGN